MTFETIQNLIRQCGHYDFESNKYNFHIKGDDKIQFKRIIQSCWDKNPEETISVDELNLLCEILKERWKRMVTDSNTRDCYLVIRTKIDRFFFEIAKEIANIYPVLIKSSDEHEPRSHYNFLMPTLLNGTDFPRDESLRKKITISDDGLYLITLDEALKHHQENRTSINAICIEKKINPYIFDLLLFRTNTDFDECEEKQLIAEKNSIQPFLENLNATSKDITRQQAYFNNHLNQLNLDQLATLSDLMHKVQNAKIDIDNSGLAILLKSDKKNWKTMRHAVKIKIIDKLIHQYKSSGSDKINIPKDIYEKFKILLAQNTSHTFNNPFVSTDSYQVFINRFQPSSQALRFKG